MTEMGNIVVADALGWKAFARVDKWQPATMRQIIGDLGLPTDPITGSILPDFEPSYNQLMALTGGPDLVTESDGNVLVNVGIQLLFEMITQETTGGATPGAGFFGSSNSYWNNANSRIGVGSGSTTSGQNATVTAAATDTGLVADTQTANIYYQGMNSTFPNSTGGINTTWQWQATFATGNANFTWQEWCIDNGITSGTAITNRTILNHKGVNLGTKTSAASWTFTTTIQIS